MTLTRARNQKLPGTNLTRVRMVVAYDGTDFAGWQRQGVKSQDKRPSIQETLENAVSTVFDSEIKIQASGRTDAGTHAEAQEVHFDAPPEWSEERIASAKLLRSLNALTPDSIGVQRLYIAPSEFHALRSSIKKTYCYRIHNSPAPNPLTHRYSYWFKKPLDLNKLNSITEPLIGNHDFKSFQSRGTELKTTVREIFEARWEPSALNPKELQFTITANGFLKQMVRNIVGTAIYLHQNGGSASEMRTILAQCDRREAKTTAPSQGLTLKRVYYPAELDNKCREI